MSHLVACPSATIALLNRENVRKEHRGGRGHAGQYDLARIPRGELDAGYETDGIGGGPESCPRGGPDVPGIIGKRAGNLEIFSSHVKLAGLTAAIRIRVLVCQDTSCDPTPSLQH